MIPIAALWANPLVRKFTLYAAAALAVLLLLRWYGNRQWYLGEAKGRITATTEMEKAKKAEWKEKESALVTAAKEIGAEKQSVATARIQMEMDRANLSRTLKDALARIQAERGKQYEGVSAIPATELDNALRTVSGQLAAANP